jgi:hypothetical protein
MEPVRMGAVEKSKFGLEGRGEALVLGGACGNHKRRVDERRPLVES